MKTIGIIPARGGSKRVKLKNIKPLGGKPLIEWTIKTALETNLDKVIVSTDHDKIAKISMACGAEVLTRPKDLAEDVDTTLVLKHVISKLELYGKLEIDAVATLQPTSPFRTAIDVDLCLGAFKNQPVINAYRNTVLTVVEASQLPQWMLKKKYGNAKYIFHTEPLRALTWSGDNLVSQSFPTLYYPNGAVYVSDRNLIMNEKRMFTEECIAVLMPPERSSDLETLWDFEVAEALLKAGVIK